MLQMTINRIRLRSRPDDQQSDFVLSIETEVDLVRAEHSLRLLPLCRWCCDEESRYTGGTWLVGLGTCKRSKKSWRDSMQQPHLIVSHNLFRAIMWPTAPNIIGCANAGKWIFGLPEKG